MYHGGLIKLTAMVGNDCGDLEKRKPLKPLTMQKIAYTSALHLTLAKHLYRAIAADLASTRFLCQDVQEYRLGELREWRLGKTWQIPVLKEHVALLFRISQKKVSKQSILQAIVQVLLRCSDSSP